MKLSKREYLAGSRPVRLGVIESRFKDWGERMKPRVLLPARLALLIMALTSLVVGLL
jgi:hypothetical protein